MKDYPSIPRATGQGFREIDDCHVFDKPDGSSMRSQWSRKRGWYKHGRRQGLLDDSNPQLAAVPELFEAKLAGPLAQIAKARGWDGLVVFYEFWGPHSLAGLHYPNDAMRLTVFDAAVEGDLEMMDPVRFRKVFEGWVDTARYLGKVHWTRGYVERVRLGEVDGITFEGVVGKAQSFRGQIVRAKAKTQAWIDRVMQVHGEVAGRRLVES
jgi:hypothetical protein